MDGFVVLGAELDAGGCDTGVLVPMPPPPPPRENQLLRFSGGEYEWIDEVEAEAEAESVSDDASDTGIEAGGSAAFLLLLPPLVLLFANNAERPATAGETLAVAGADDARPLTLGTSPTSAVAAAGAFLLLTLPLSPPRVAEVKALAASRRLSPLFLDLAFLLLAVV